MYDAGPRWNLIQWIELYNSSMTQVGELCKGWELEIRNATDDVESYVDSGFVFNERNDSPEPDVVDRQWHGYERCSQTIVYITCINITVVSWG